MGGQSEQATGARPPIPAGPGRIGKPGTEGNAPPARFLE